MLKSHFSLWVIILLLFGHFSNAQKNESEYAYELDSTLNEWKPTGLRVGVDVSGPIYTLFEPTTNWYELAADMDFHKFFAVVEVGRGNYNSNVDTSSYSSRGAYYRVGVDANFIARDPNLNVFFFGLRYAGASFNEKLSGDLPSSGWGSQMLNLEKNKSSANWVEMNIGMRVRVWKSIFAGYNARLKMLKHNEFSEGKFQSYYIPGYGRAERTVNWGFDYYIYYRFSWKKKPIPWRKN